MHFVSMYHESNLLESELLRLYECGSHLWMIQPPGDTERYLGTFVAIMTRGSSWCQVGGGRESAPYLTAPTMTSLGDELAPGQKF